MGYVQARNLGKAYRQYPTRLDRLLEWMNPISTQRHQRKWILEDVNFEINPGEAVGIIGVNGAGKSTLLKLITGTIQPTTGTVSLVGRVVALLELGMGFHPDFTGRQNIMLSGQLIGLSANQISELMSEIEAFADIGEYIDQPIRTYSSGMQVRLAFSVATAVRPDILIVDEALTVGDIYFQQKSYNRINNFIKSGTTLLFVSHSMGTVLNICSRAILIRKGRIAYDGLPQDAIALYQSELIESLDKKPEQLKLVQPELKVIHSQTAENIASDVSNQIDTETSPIVTGKLGSIHTSVVKLSSIRLFDHKGCENYAFISDTEITIEIEYNIEQYLHDPHVGFIIKNRFGIVLFETNTYCMRKSIGPVEASSVLSVKFTLPLNIAPDEYTITLGFARSGYDEASFEQTLSYLNEAIMFTVLPNRASITWSGQINLNPSMHFEKIGNDDGFNSTEKLDGFKGSFINALS